MLFGLNNVFEIFQQIIIDIIRVFIRYFIEVYIDKFTMFGSQKDYCEFLQKTFQKCRKSNLKIHSKMQSKKWFIEVTKGILLEHVN